MQAQATLRYLRVSPQKARLVIDMIRGKAAEDALQVLEVSHKRVSRDVRKLLWSAIANAKEKEGLKDEANLRVVKAIVNPGPTLKRGRARAMGRSFRILHRTSHITLVLSDESPS